MLFPIRRAWLSLWRHSAAPTGDGGVAEAASPPAGEGRAETPPPAAGVFDAVSDALASACAVLSNFLELVSLEARRAGLTLVWMVALGVVAGVCLIAAWLGLMAALALWAISLGMSTIAAVIAVALVNGVAGAALIYLCIGLSRDLLFSATRRQLAGSPPAKPPAP